MPSIKNKMEGNIFTQKNHPINNRGFTLIEVLIAVSILTILTGLIAPGFSFFKKQSTLESATQEITQTLRLAQNRTLASEGDTNFGVYFEANKFVLFKGLVYSASATDNEVHNIDSSLTISSINFGGAVAYVVFERLTGTTANYGSLVVRQASDTTQNKTIYVDQSGIISLAVNPASDTSRDKDSRHVDVLFSQSVKTATTLALVFPADSITENVTFQTYLNAGKTEFSWEGTVTVAGQEQKFMIHTHSLTDSAALFSIHRDLRYNTKAVNINLDDQNLINYAADGTVTDGSSAWSGPAQIQ